MKLKEVHIQGKEFGEDKLLERKMGNIMIVWNWGEMEERKEIIIGNGR